jgi:GT2 family glycosyltransferase
VQFIDGDCQMIDAWWKSAADSLEANDNVVAICGRQNETDRNGTIYNRLMDMEWNTPVGVVKSCAGCAMYRADAFASVGGFDPNVIAGEEPELCVRLRERGWTIIRIDAPMAYHDANMTRFTQWWMRNVRAGYAYAQGSAMHGRPPERHWVRETRSIWFWGFIVPLLATAMALPTRGWSLILFAAYPVLGLRVWQHVRRRGNTQYDSAVYAFFTVLGKFPQFYGQIKFRRRAIRGERHALIEHKQS